MRVTIRQTDRLSDEEQQRLFQWAPDAFGVAQYGLKWRPKDVHFLLEADGTPLSHVGILRHSVRVEGHAVTVAGFGGVITVPEAQKRGHARALMTHAAGFAAQEWKVNAGFLFCLPRMVRYYEKLGWQVIEPRVNIEQPSGTIASPLRAMVLPLGAYAWPAGQVELDSLPW